MKKNQIKVKKIGITGGIGSGKTTVCQIFETLGIPIYYADTEAKRIMVEDAHLITKIKNLFGKEAYTTEGQLNRAFIGNLVFKDKKLLEKLNAIVHPALAEDYEKWHDSQKLVPYTLKEAAILFEMGAYKIMDKVITVSAPIELRIKRVMARDKVEKAAVLNRISKQMPEEEKEKRADFIVHNDGKQGLIEQVLKIHKILIPAYS